MERPDVHAYFFTLIYNRKESVGRQKNYPAAPQNCFLKGGCPWFPSYHSKSVANTTVAISSASKRILKIINIHQTCWIC